MTIIDTAVHESLRILKRSGMLHTLDARLAQARAGELGHIEFLQVLCHDEISRRDTQAIARRLRRARFETQTTIEEFNWVRCIERVLAWLYIDGCCCQIVRASSLNAAATRSGAGRSMASS